MKPILIAALAVLVSLPAIGAASAAPPQNTVVAQYDRHHYDWDRDNRDPHAWHHRHPYAYATHPRWSRGDRLYRQYWGPHYYVTDWRVRHLRRPPHGYRWVDVDGDYFLVAISTGIIMDMMVHRMHDERYDHDRYR